MNQLKKVIGGNALLRSGLKFANRIGLFKVLTDKPIDARNLCTEMKLKESHGLELIFSLVSCGAIQMNDKSEVYISFECRKQLMSMLNDSPSHELEKFFDPLEKCFQLHGQLGYHSDEASQVWKVINKMRQHKELAIEIVTCIKKYHTGDVISMLDLGCGNGDFTRPFAEQCTGARVRGCDISEPDIKEAKANSMFLKESLTFHLVDGQTYPEDWYGEFDVVTMIDVLHDLAERKKVMEEVRKTIKDDGILVCMDPFVSNTPLKNVGDFTASSSLMGSCLYCLPSCKHPVNQVGVGWGIENKREFLKENGFETITEVSLLNSGYNHTLICKKALKK